MIKQSKTKLKSKTKSKSQARLKSKTLAQKKNYQLGRLEVI